MKRKLWFLALLAALAVLTGCSLGKEQPPVEDAPAAEAPAAEAPASQPDSDRESQPEETPPDREEAEPAPALQEAPAPAAEEEQAACTLSITCAVLLDRLDQLEEGVRELVPADGVLLPPTAVELEEGDSVFDLLQRACRDAGILACTGDGIDAGVMAGALAAIRSAGGLGVPTVKPWDKDTVFEKLEAVRKADPVAIAMDIDGAGLPFLQHRTPPAGSKTGDELKQVVAWAEKPFILKGIMTVSGAKKALEAGAKAIVVSNHGGRVLDQCPATAEVLPAIADAVGGRMTILVDGGIRTGMDVFKALALGADAVLIGRPFVNMVYGGGAEGVKVYVEKLKAELADTMAMCGAHSLSDINRSMIYGY